MLFLGPFIRPQLSSIIISGDGFSEAQLCMNIKKRDCRCRSPQGSHGGASGKPSGLLRCMPLHPRRRSTLLGLRLPLDLVVVVDAVAVVLVWWMNFVFYLGLRLLLRQSHACLRLCRRGALGPTQGHDSEAINK